MGESLFRAIGPEFLHLCGRTTREVLTEEDIPAVRRGVWRVGATRPAWPALSEQGLEDVVNILESLHGNVQVQIC